jgi:phosphate-selective porin OprO/OprP
MAAVAVVMAASMALATAVPAAQDKPKEEQSQPPQQPQPEQPAEKPKDAPVKVTAGADGFVIQSADGEHRLRITGYAQGDGRFFLSDDDDAATDTFLLRRARPIVQGTLARRFDFTIVPDFGGGQTVLQDAYLDARFTPAFRVRVGKYKAPFGLERLQSASNLLFVERAFPASIAPNRDVGIQVHGEVAGGAFAYAAAFLDGVPDGGSVDTDTNDGKDVVLRGFLLPLKKRKDGPQVGLGFAASFGKQDGPAPSYRTPAQQAFFSYAQGVTASGSRERISPQGYFYAGPFGVIGEYVRSTQRLRGATDRVKVTNDAWQAAASVYLTGEKAGWSAVKPSKPFDPSKGRWGALELAARVHALDVDDDIFTGGLADPTRIASKAEAWTVGLTWYLNRNVKYVVNFEQTRFDGGRAGGDRRKENAVLVRAQVSF